MATARYGPDAMGLRCKDADRRVANVILCRQAEARLAVEERGRQPANIALGLLVRPITAMRLLPSLGPTAPCPHARLQGAHAC